MIVREHYKTRTDGVELYRTYSDAGYLIRQAETGAEYDEAIDVEQAASALDDKTVSLAPELLGTLTGDGSLVKAGTRINWHGKIKKAAVDLWDTAQNTPDKASTLWEDVQYRDGYRIIPEVITSTLAFAKGEKGWWGGNLYESLMDGNVFTPTVAPTVWKKVE